MPCHIHEISGVLLRMEYSLPVEEARFIEFHSLHLLGADYKPVGPCLLAMITRFTMVVEHDTAKGTMKLDHVLNIFGAEIYEKVNRKGTSGFGGSLGVYPAKTSGSGQGGEDAEG